MSWSSVAMTWSWLFCNLDTVGSILNINGLEMKVFMCPTWRKKHIENKSSIHRVIIKTLNRSNQLELIGLFTITPWIMLLFSTSFLLQVGHMNTFISRPFTIKYIKNWAHSVQITEKSTPSHSNTILEIILPFDLKRYRDCKRAAIENTCMTFKECVPTIIQSLLWGSTALESHWWVGFKYLWE